MNRGSLAVWVIRLWRLMAGLWLMFSVPAALAQISYVGSTSADGGSSALGSITIARPAGVLFGDLLIAQVAVNPATSAISVPSGWTLIDEVVSDNVRQRLYSRTVANVEPVSYTFSLAPSARVAAGVVAMRGAELVSPVFSAYSERIGNSNQAIANEVSVALAGSALLAFFGIDNGNTALTANPALTQAFVDQSGAGPNGVSIVAGYQLGMAIGTTGTRSAAIGSAFDWGAQMVALRPAVQTCFTDNFNRASLGADWAVTRRNGAFDPAIVNGRMRMTQASGNQSTAATLQRLVPADGNLVTIEFDQYAYGGNGADGIVFVLSDASVTPQPGAYGGSLGYANNNSLSGFAGGWLGIGIDEYGNFSRTNEGRRGLPSGWTTPNGIGPTTSALRPDAVVVRGSMPNYYFIAGTNNLSPGLDVTANGATGPGHRYRLTVDSRVAGEAWITVERDAGAGYVILIPRFNILAANSAQQDASGVRRTPDNFLISITGSTGGSTHNHELDNLNICALSLLPFTAEIDHFRFYHDGSASACQAEPVRLLACADAACGSLYAGSVSATLTSAGGQWQDAGGNDLSGNVVNFSGGAVNLQLLRNSTGVETLGVSASTPPTKPLSVPKCYNSATNAQFASCTLSFTDTQSFAFGVPPVSAIPSQEAGVESAAVRIKATSSSCGGGTPPAFRNQMQPIQFSFAYLDPLQATVDGLITVAANRPRLYLDPWEGNSGGVPSNSTQSFQRLDLSNISLNVYFNNSGEGYFQIVYPDVGQLRLSATGSGGIAGSSSFVVKPWEFMVDSVVRTADGVVNPAAADAGGGAFIAAGDDFSLRVTARSAPHKITDGSGSSVTNPVVTTPYGRVAKLFGKEQTAEGVRLTSDAGALQPAGGANPALANGDIPGAGFGSGANLGLASVSNLSWPEVGIIRVQPRILPTGSETSGDYLGAGDVTRYSSPNIGRFHPKEFALADVVFANRQALACAPASSFSYFDEAMGVDFALEARSNSGSITRNYADAFARLALPGGGATLNFAAARPAPAFAPLSARLVLTGFAGNWPAVGAMDGGRVSLSGQVSISSLNTPPSNRVSPDGPFLGAKIGVAPQDSDGVRIAGYDLDSDNSGGAGGPDRRTVATSDLYFGQLRLMPAIGSERLPLAMSAEVQRWMGTGFVPNGDDSCTTIPLARLGLRDWAGNLNAGETTIVSGPASFLAGRAILRLSAPGTANSGRVNVTADLAGAGLAYLGGRWPELPAVVDATPMRFDDAPWATAAFGLYRGVNQVIHRRENY